MSSEYEKLFGEISNLRRMVANMIMPATVHEVKGDRMRMSMGKDSDGKDNLGPWLDTGGDMRGGGRERKFYKKGQNLMMISPNGDPAQAFVVPYAPNKNHKPPDHANKSGQDEETYQLDDLRVKKTKSGYAIWLQEGKKDDQQGGQQGEQGQQSGSGGGGSGDSKQQRKVYEHEPQEAEARIALRLDNDGGITARIGKDKRFMVNKDGVKMKAGNDYAVVKDGQLICSKEWQVGGDPISDDDKI